jgi:hypothetical protein
MDPAEIADFVSYVSSAFASAINGASFRVDGSLVRSMFEAVGRTGHLCPGHPSPWMADQSSVCVDRFHHNGSRT